MSTNKLISVTVGATVNVNGSYIKIAVTMQDDVKEKSDHGFLADKLYEKAESIVLDKLEEFTMNLVEGKWISV